MLIALGILTATLQACAVSLLVMQTRYMRKNHHREEMREAEKFVKAMKESRNLCDVRGCK